MDKYAGLRAARHNRNEKADGATKAETPKPDSDSETPVAQLPKSFTIALQFVFQLAKDGIPFIMSYYLFLKCWRYCPIFA